jgi:23S rRNA pseudouridine1911/1915/1917 synthase
MVGKIIEPEALATLDLPEAEGETGETQTETRCWRVEAQAHGTRLDRFLAAHVPEVSRSYLQQLIAQGAVCVDGGVQTKAARRLHAGDEVTLELRPTAQAQAFVPQPMRLPVVYEDADVLVIDKPAGLVVHPAAGHWSGTLLNGLLAHHPGAAVLPRAGIVHRLDKDTSGLMVVAKTPAAYDALVRQIATRAVQRVYVALVHGPWRQAQALSVEQPIGRDPRQRLRMAVHAKGSPAAKPARTDVRCLDDGLGEGGRDRPAVLVACKLHTGRTHQIRVHLAWLGQPLVGDVLYGGVPMLGLARQGLHAVRLGFAHPGQPDRWLAFESPLPADMRQAIEQAGLHYNPARLWSVQVPASHIDTPADA